MGKRKMNYQMVTGEIDKRTDVERLADLKQYLLDEQRSAVPSAIYIEDLELSIKTLEKKIGFK